MDIMAQEGSNGELPAGPGVGHQCPYCKEWFYSTAFYGHMDDEFDMKALLGKTEFAKEVAS